MTVAPTLVTSLTSLAFTYSIMEEPILDEQLEALSSLPAMTMMLHWMNMVRTENSLPSMPSVQFIDLITTKPKFFMNSGR